MKKITFPVSFLLIAFALTPFPLMGAETNASTKRPNIILILADDMGYGSVAANNPKCTIPTPALDRLVKEGMNFTDGHSGSTVCTPTRYSIMTGRYAWRSGLKGGVLWPWYPPLIEPEELTVAEMLQQQGYRTAMVGKWHLGLEYTDVEGDKFSEKSGFSKEQFIYCANRKAAPFPYAPNPAMIDFSQPVRGGPIDHGFDEYFGVDLPNMPPYVFIRDDQLLGRPSVQKPKGMFGVPGPMLPGWTLEAVLPRLAKEAVAMIDRQKASDNPFFLYFSLTSPHTPIAPSEAFQGKSGLNPYADWIMETDWAVGEVLDALDRNHLSENTLVIFSTDNGTTEMTSQRELIQKGCDLIHQYRGLKRSLYEGGHRVPYIVRWPAIVTAGSSCDEPVSLNDFMATSAAILGVDLSGNTAVDSFNLLPLYRGGCRELLPPLIHHGFNGGFALRDGDWKICYHLKRGGNEFRLELYNLSEDPKESHNLAAKYPEKVETMTHQLRELIRLGRCTPGPAQANVEHDAWLIP